MAPAAPPPFAPRPARSALQALGADRVASPQPCLVAEEPPAPWRPAALGAPPGELDVPPEFLCAARSSPSRRTAQPNWCLPPTLPSRGRRACSEAPPLATCMERGVEDFGYLSCATSTTTSSRPPLIRNVATFERPKECSKHINRIASLQQPVAQALSSSRSTRRGQRSQIDVAIQREFMGEGLALEQAVDARRDAGWAVKHRHVQRSDVGHCCFACRQPLRDMNEEVVVWTGAAIYRRFHPRCAASYMLRADNENSNTSSGSQGAPVADVVEGYADGWRALRDDNRPLRAVEAARQWLLSQDPTAFASLRGDLFTTVTINVNGKKQAVPGLTHDQLNALQLRHRWHPAEVADEEREDADEPDQLECPICFGVIDHTTSAPCVQLPCAPQHVCHVECVWPWLKKASICPVCRKDLRPLLPPARGSSMPPLSRS